MNKTAQVNSEEGITIPPSFQLPLIITILGLFLLFIPLSPWPTVIVTGFGLFLLLQSFTLRLKITEKDFIVLQFGKELRRFPFKSWIAWKIFLPQLPGLLYFREEASPHLLPLLFDPKILETQLKLRVKNIEIQKN